MPGGVLFGIGTLNVRITPDGFPVLSVDGDEVGRIEHFEFCTTLLDGGIRVLYGRVVITHLNENSETYIKRLRLVPWLVVDVLEPSEEPVPDTIRSQS